MTCMSGFEDGVQSKRHARVHNRRKKKEGGGGAKQRGGTAWARRARAVSCISMETAENYNGFKNISGCGVRGHLQNWHGQLIGQKWWMALTNQMFS